jgi:hypothetical protein
MEAEVEKIHPQVKKEVWARVRKVRVVRLK